MSGRKLLLALFGGIAVASAVLLALPFRAPPSDKVTISAGQIKSALIYVAIDKGYFADEGIDVTLVSRPTGKQSLAMVNDGTADVAAVAVYPVMATVLEGRPVKIFATIMDSYKELAVVARKDAGITSPKDLIGKSLAFLPGTNTEVFTHIFLEYHGIPASQVTLVPVAPEEAVRAVLDGKVSALSTLVDIRIALQKALADRAVVFMEEGIYTDLWTLAAKSDFVTRRPETVARLLRALLKAERFLAQYPDETIAIVARQLNLSPDSIAALWDIYNFGVKLDQTLVVNLESEARWKMRGQGVAKTPNFLDTISLDGLLSVEQSRVTVAR